MRAVKPQRTISSGVNVEPCAGKQKAAVARAAPMKRAWMPANALIWHVRCVGTPSSERGRRRGSR